MVVKPSMSPDIRVGDLPVLDETNVGSLLAEALTADVEAVLADQTSLVGADTASARALAVSAGAGVPDRLVRHLERLMEFFLAKKGKFRRGVGLA